MEGGACPFGLGLLPPTDTDHILNVPWEKWSEIMDNGYWTGPRMLLSLLIVMDDSPTGNPPEDPTHPKCSSARHMPDWDDPSMMTPVRRCQRRNPPFCIVQTKNLSHYTLVCEYNSHMPWCNGLSSIDGAYWDPRRSRWAVLLLDRWLM